ncbi:lactate dehydrogenase1 [Zea mays]|uniref:Lactate dehydrogenase1 n=1 Tax=Zea mays TaxID=4577 RepID=A0A1D6GY24_MAIZE|nr:lactate dehydrogenase1 [Zea mays]
MITSPSLFIN